MKSSGPNVTEIDAFFIILWTTLELLTRVLNGHRGTESMTP